VTVVTLNRPGHRSGGPGRWFPPQVVCATRRPGATCRDQVSPRSNTTWLVEDLHWADPTMREVFDLVVGRVERLLAMVLIMLAAIAPHGDRPCHFRWTRSHS
jgi:hypothetical protein